MRQPVPFTCVLLVCASVLKAQGQTTPSPRFMVESWKAWVNAFTHQAHSYRLQGREVVVKSSIKVAGVSMVGRTWTWQTIKQNAQYRYENAQPEEFKAVSYDGTKWYYVVHTLGASPQHSVMTKGPYIGGSVLTSFQQEETHPQTIEAFMNSPGIYPSDIPMPDQFLAQPQALHLVGVETISGKVCYHIHSNAKLSVPTPGDVWLTQTKQYFVPWQTQTTVANAPARGMITVQAGAEFAGIWYPTACNYRIDEGDAQHGWKSYDETAKQFVLSDINNVFPVADFRLKPLKGSDTFMDDTFISPPTPKPAPSARLSRDTLRRGLLTLFVMCSALLLLTLFKRHPQSK